jgi:hypothetical protein
MILKTPSLRSRLCFLSSTSTAQVVNICSGKDASKLSLLDEYVHHFSILELFLLIFFIYE